MYKYSYLGEKKLFLYKHAFEQILFPFFGQ